MVVEQSRVAETLDNLVASHSLLEIRSINEPAQLRDIIVASLKQVLEDNEQNKKVDDDDDAAEKNVEKDGEINELPSDLPLWLSALETKGLMLSKQLRILESLRFPTMLKREVSMKEAHPTTFDWFFEDNQKSADRGVKTTILDWLRTGTGVYYESRQTEPPWTHAELLQTFSRLREQSMATRFCFFIDGLDEFDGDHMGTIDFINSLTSSNNIKICFSSRPVVLLGNFMYHAHQMELRGRLDYYLFPKLDRTMALHRGGRYNMDCDWDHLGLKVGHHEAWLTDRALKEGIQGYLAVAADNQVKILNERKLVSGPPPLDVAPRSIDSSRLRNEIVKQLLDQGADPNERCEGRSGVWELYLLTHENSITVPKEETSEIAITRMLLTSGADPKLGRTFHRAVRAHFRPEEVEKQENPRLLDKQALKQSQKKSPRVPHGKAQEQGKKSPKISILNIGKRLRGK